MLLVEHAGARKTSKTNNSLAENNDMPNQTCKQTQTRAWLVMNHLIFTKSMQNGINVGSNVSNKVYSFFGYCQPSPLLAGSTVRLLIKRRRCQQDIVKQLLYTRHYKSMPGCPDSPLPSSPINSVARIFPRGTLLTSLL